MEGIGIRRQNGREAKRHLPLLFFCLKGLTDAFYLNIVYLYNKYTIERREGFRGNHYQQQYQ